ncbi:AI-2E family transporter [Hyphomicrobium sp.]|uniref:AI-2E family transporter n=1 Tax=Hyphomicrobium sp. TaxID=82 RepID=UPI002E370645|nr:AI-2E family transporter [Hyphomicrobium sp.]HEX2841835.1 AI-2E family transporter [Hyphomicrobium sp.]
MIGLESRRIAPIVCASILTVAGLYLARSVLAPFAVAMFAIAVVWPVQKRLETTLPQLAALAITLLATTAALGWLLALTVWAIGQVGRWLALNAAHMHDLYVNVTQWLETHGIYVVGLFVDRFDVLWLARPFQEIASTAYGLVGFTILVLIFMMLGLLEVGVFKKKLETLQRGDLGRRILAAGAVIATKFRRYAVIRAVASALTGLMVGTLCWLLGVDLAMAWGVLAFVLNFIPFIGPFFATILPALFAVAQFQSWEAAAAILAGASVIQFLIGSYLEPRLSGTALSISPLLVVFSVFFVALLWGIPGAFMGVPLTIALLTVFEQSPETSWISELLSGAGKAPEQQP